MIHKNTSNTNFELYYRRHKPNEIIDSDTNKTVLTETIYHIEEMMQMIIYQLLKNAIK